MSLLVSSLNPRMERSERPVVKGKCFICLVEVNIAELSQHEKECLDKLQEVDMTRSTTSAGSDSDRDSDLSSTSAGSGTTQKRVTRCYICGKDFSQRFLSIHEKQCKRRWELGIIGHTEKPEKESRSSSIGNLHKVADSERPKPVAPSSLRKAKSYSNVHIESKANGHVTNTQSEKRKASSGGLNSKPRTKSSSHGNLTKAADRRLSGDFAKSPEKPIVRSQTATPRSIRGSDRVQTSPALRKEKSRSHSNLYVKGIDSTVPAANDSKRPISALSALSCNDLRHVGKSSSTDSGATPIRKGTGRVVMCSICKRGFSIYSVYIHEKNCQKKQELLQEKEKENQKEAAAQRSRIKAQEGIKVKLIEPSSTPRKNSNGTNAVNGKTEDSPTLKSPRSETPVQAFQRCYICGNLYGSRSLAIHEPQCMRKWEMENEKLPKSKRKDRPDRATSPWGHASPPKMVDKRDTPPGMGSPSETGAIQTNGNRRSSTPTNGSRIISPSTSDKEKRQPRMKECKYCEKLYSLASLPLHEPKCHGKVDAEQTAVD